MSKKTILACLLALISLLCLGGQIWISGRIDVKPGVIVSIPGQEDEFIPSEGHHQLFAQEIETQLKMKGVGEYSIIDNSQIPLLASQAIKLTCCFFALATVYVVCIILYREVVKLSSQVRSGLNDMYFNEWFKKNRSKVFLLVIKLLIGAFMIAFAIWYLIHFAPYVPPGLLPEKTLFDLGFYLSGPELPFGVEYWPSLRNLYILSLVSGISAWAVALILTKEGDK